MLSSSTQHIPSFLSHFPCSCCRSLSPTSLSECAEQQHSAHAIHHHARTLSACLMLTPSFSVPMLTPSFIMHTPSISVPHAILPHAHTILHHAHTFLQCAPCSHLPSSCSHLPSVCLMLTPSCPMLTPPFSAACRLAHAELNGYQHSFFHAGLISLPPLASCCCAEGDGAGTAALTPSLALPLSCRADLTATARILLLC